MCFSCGTCGSILFDFDAVPQVKFWEREKESSMPLKRGSSKKTVSKNISEFHKGTTYAKTKKKFGAAKANAQAVAAALSQARKSKKKKSK